MEEPKTEKPKKQKKPNKGPTASEAQIDALKKHVAALQKKLTTGGPVTKATGQAKPHMGKANVAEVAHTRDYVGGAPRVTHTKAGDCEVVHTEFIGTVVQLVSDLPPTGLLVDILNWNLVSKINPFSAGQVYGGSISVNAINPLNQAIFKALSGIAVNYEKYQFTHLEFRYGNRTATSTVGDVMLAWDMDCDDAPPGNKEAFLNFKRNVSGVPYDDKAVVIPPQPCPLFINQLAEQGPAASAPALIPEPRTCNYGSFFFAGGNINAIGQIGNLFVSYKVKLFEFQNRPEQQIASSYFQATPPVSPTATTPLGTTVVRPRLAQGVTLGEYTAPATGTTTQAVVFGETGEYLVDFVYNGTGVMSAGPGIHAATLDGTTVGNPEDVATIFVDTVYNFAGTLSGVRSMFVRIIEAPAALAMWVDSFTTLTNVLWSVARLLPGTTTGPQIDFTVPNYLPIAPFFERELGELGTTVVKVRKTTHRGAVMPREQDEDKVVITTITKSSKETPLTKI